VDEYPGNVGLGSSKSIFCQIVKHDYSCFRYRSPMGGKKPVSWKACSIFMHRPKVIIAHMYIFGHGRFSKKLHFGTSDASWVILIPSDKFSKNKSIFNFLQCHLQTFSGRESNLLSSYPDNRFDLDLELCATRKIAFRFFPNVSRFSIFPTV